MQGRGNSYINFNVNVMFKAVKIFVLILMTFIIWGFCNTLINESNTIAVILGFTILFIWIVLIISAGLKQLTGEREKKQNKE